MDKIDLNKPEDVQKELEKFVKENFGSNVQVITQAMDQLGENFAKQSQQTQAEAEEKEAVRQEKIEDILKFDKIPKDIKSHLDQYVISQDEAKKTLAIAICDHYNQVKYYNSLSDDEKKDHSYSKQNVLLLGPTGVGKTYMVKELAKLIGVPFVKADATKYSETGYMGANVEDLIKDLVQQADDDLTQAEFGIVYIDEADKLGTRGSKHHGKDVNGRGVQLGLLKMMEETDVDLRSGNDPSSHMQQFMEMQAGGGKLPDKIINTRNILFILSGAFTGLDEIIGKRLSKKAIGFSASEKREKNLEEELLKKVTTEDLVEFGLEPEFIGRLPVRVSCNSLSTNDLYHILKDSKGSVLSQYQRAFGAYGINVDFTDEALLEIAKLAHKENTGARSLMTIIESSLREFKFQLPGTNISSLTIDKNLIQNPEGVLSELLKSATTHRKELLDEIAIFEDFFKDSYELDIKFSGRAIDAIASEMRYFSGTVAELLSTKLTGYEHGLKLVVQNIGDQTLTIESDCITNPQSALETWVKSSYSAAGNSEPVADETPGHTLH